MPKQDIEAIKRKHPIEQFVRDSGHDIVMMGGQPVTCCWFHDDKNPSMRLSPDIGKYFCFSCQSTGDVVDLYCRKHDCSTQVALEALGDADPTRTPPEANKRAEETLKAPLEATGWVKVDQYDYENERGDALYFVSRYEDHGNGKKQFKQWHEKGGEKIWGIKGITRVLWRLPQVIQSPDVVLCEGEKCVKAFESIDYVATTNSGGSSGWVDAYSEWLEGKIVYLCPDNDAPGKKWEDAVLKSLEGKVQSVKVVRMPEAFNDFADFLIGKTPDEARGQFAEMIGAATELVKGVDIPVQSASEVYESYLARCQTPDRSPVDLSKWLNSLHQIRRRGPGDLVGILGGTGVGKSMILQNIAVAIAPLTVLIFEIELMGEDMAERFVAMTRGETCTTVEYNASKGNRVGIEGWEHVYMCAKSTIDVDEMEELAGKLELKAGKKPDVIMVDYIGLMQGKGGSRYEKLSSIAEGMKRLAKNTETCVFFASQVSRNPNKDADREDVREIRLDDGKDSGAIEASSGLVMGAWREDDDTMIVKVLKDTKGGFRGKVVCDFRGDRMQITERMQAQHDFA